MAIMSMTGHGAAELSRGGVNVAVDLMSVNHRQLDLRMVLPDLPASVGARMAERIRKRLARGAVTCRVMISDERKRGNSGIVVDENAAGFYVRRLRKLAARLGLKDDLGLSALAAMPGVIRAPSLTDDFAAVQPLLFHCLDQALAALVAMRRAEGKALGSDIERRIGTLNVLVDRAASRAPSVSRKHRKELLSRIGGSGVNIDPDDPRVVREVALFADRSDISEEITRLRSHMRQLAMKLSASGSVGRTLDFLVQEMSREINTIGSKANDKNIAADVILFKSELERIREQIQNVE